MNKNIYHEQVDLLLQVLPIIAKHKEFALKGGTAINLFLRDMPRLSVDIDLTFLPILNRQKTLEAINSLLIKIKDEVEKTLPTVKVSLKAAKDGFARKLTCDNLKAQVKVEVNEIIRSTVFDCQHRELCDSAQEVFDFYVEIQAGSFADIYGGKVCAALDRQHPRDLFDVKILLENEGLSEEVRKAFIIYLISNNRPISELINPNRLDISQAYESNFVGMNYVDVTLDKLIEVRERLINTIDQELTDQERAFLISFKKGEPKWSLLSLSNIDKLPSIKWKLMNISKIPLQKHSKALDELKRKLKV